MKIRLIGDTHGNIDMLLTPTDCEYTIVLGDFGVTGKNLTKLNKHLELTGHRVLFVDGNHEHYPKIKRAKEVEMFGGKVGVYSTNVFWLKRGEVYEINGKKILTFGGAFSIDRIYRIEGVSWFPEEQYSEEDYHNLCENIEKHNSKFDYILSHDCPKHIVQYLYGYNSYPNKTSDLLENISNTCDFSKWYFGHHHTDIKIDKFVGVWERKHILEL